MQKCTKYKIQDLYKKQIRLSFDNEIVVILVWNMLI